MKVTIDTTNKTIKVEEQINIDELNAELKSMLGDKVGEYTLIPFEYKWTGGTLVYPTPNYPYYLQPTTILCDTNVAAAITYAYPTATCQ